MTGVADEGLADTPRRVAAAFAEFLTPLPFTPTTFPNDEGYDELVVARSIPFRSLCQHHLLPFHGVAHVGYLPGERLLGLSKLALGGRAARQRPHPGAAHRAGRLAPGAPEPRGSVVIDAEHLRMTVRGVQAPGVRTVTSALRRPGPRRPPHPR